MLSVARPRFQGPDARTACRRAPAQLLHKRRSSSGISTLVVHGVRDDAYRALGSMTDAEIEGLLATMSKDNSGALQSRCGPDALALTQ